MSYEENKKVCFTQTKNGYHKQRQKNKGGKKIYQCTYFESRKIVCDHIHDIKNTC